jgi:hypothetical protein
MVIDMVGLECPLNVAVFEILKCIKRFKTCQNDFKLIANSYFSQLNAF